MGTGVTGTGVRGGAGYCVFVLLLCYWERERERPTPFIGEEAGAALQASLFLSPSHKTFILQRVIRHTWGRNGGWFLIKMFPNYIAKDFEAILPLTF